MDTPLKNVLLERMVSTFIYNNVYRPNADFVEFIVASMNNGHYDDRLAALYAPIIADYMKQGVPIKLPEMNAIPSRITMGSELRAYRIIKDMLGDDVGYTQLSSYSIVHLPAVVQDWVVRLSLRGQRKYICFPSDGYKTAEWIEISEANDLRKMRGRLKRSLFLAKSKRAV